MSKGSDRRPSSRGLSEEVKKLRWELALGKGAVKENARRELIKLGVLKDE